MDIGIRGNSHLKKQANKLLGKSKKLANSLYEEGKDTISHVSEDIKDYSDLVIKKARKRPLATWLLISGISLIVLSTFIRR
ncbi:hypothetical protein [Legionella cardiaca]|uniref:DUF883 domain-containing protein n=1 Tax=Legionella cardiaca TaxID=1071983 RepID=A0ABY8AQX7_9GAMM|nr:hypothetical protein [Legionella cardiaca]WED43082.1 hypothetical protein PXX05_14465 [Legionella cardiaca]